jgi:hypothetical protein
MRIKKHKRNQYILCDGVWVRNPYLDAEPVDINDLAKGDIDLLLGNEISNLKKKSFSKDEFLNSGVDHAIICSDGYMWNERQFALASIPNKQAKILGVNSALSKWTMVGDLSAHKRVMSYYLVNNPYDECISYLPSRHKYYPPLVSSTRTNPEFLDKYPEKPIFYCPTKDLRYAGAGRDGCITLDDYRNPVCAAISYCAKMGVKKLALFCCDEAFQEYRPGSEKMKNGLYQYPQQIMSQKIIDHQIYWLRSRGVEVADCSSGIEYSNAAYINIENLASFFNNGQS